MPPQPAELFDRALLRRRMARAAEQAARHDFLLARAVEDMLLRLQAVLRDFPLALDLGTPGDRLAQGLLHHPRVGRVIAAGYTAMAESDEDRILGLRCDEEALPFAPSSLDLVATAFALHAVNDLPGTLLQVRRALKPDGLFLGALLGGRTLHELRQCLTEAEVAVCGGASPRVAPFADVRDCGALLQRAGFALPVADADIVTVSYSDILALMRDLRGMGMTNVLKERARRPMRRDVLRKAGEIYASRHRSPDGRVGATFEILHLTGWAPHESQPKPLAPGSARSRLADALATTERSAGEKAGPAKRKN
ncbi:MAG: methyltransferase domain-containing protein [Pseudomonadota bacterium]|nr:methyltransferase domain-containing protein [Pseudomonadota bacterium]